MGRGGFWAFFLFLEILTGCGSVGCSWCRSVVSREGFWKICGGEGWKKIWFYCR